MAHNPTQELPRLAPSAETQAVHAALGMYKNHHRELLLRCCNCHLVVPEQQDAERAFLEGWGTQLDAEIARIFSWARDLQHRQIGTGELVPQHDGSFHIGEISPATTPAVTTASKLGSTAVAAGAAVAGGTSGRTKVGLLGLGMIGICFIIPPLASSVGVLGALLLIGWVLAALFGGSPAKPAAPQSNVETDLDAARQAAAELAADQADQAVQRQAEAKAEAEARRAEAIKRARSRVTESDDEWD